MQNGIAVPTFDWQPRPRIDLDGEWRVESVPLDQRLSMESRETVLAAIENEASGRHLPTHDDSGWGLISVPGTTNAPPDGVEGGAWYRRTFDVPADWAGRAITLRFGSANYVADVWLNGSWLGYHEGGATPFAFDVSPAVEVGAANVLSVRVHTIPLGTRSDVVPWGLIDWWNYGGLTGSVWLEATAPSHLARADVVTHLDAIDINVVLAHATRLAGSRGEGNAAVDAPTWPGAVCGRPCWQHQSMTTTSWIPTRVRSFRVSRWPRWPRTSNSRRREASSAPRSPCASVMPIPGTQPSPPCTSCECS